MEGLGYILLFDWYLIGDGIVLVLLVLVVLKCSGCMFV